MTTRLERVPLQLIRITWLQRIEIYSLVIDIPFTAGRDCHSHGSAFYALHLGLSYIWLPLVAIPCPNFHHKNAPPILAQLLAFPLHFSIFILLILMNFSLTNGILNSGIARIVNFHGILFTLLNILLPLTPVSKFKFLILDL